MAKKALKLCANQAAPRRRFRLGDAEDGWRPALPRNPRAIPPRAGALHHADRAFRSRLACSMPTRPASTILSPSPLIRRNCSPAFAPESGRPNSYDELVSKATGSQALNAQLATVNSRLERLSITDELTGLFNRRHAMFRLEEQWALAERYGAAAQRRDDRHRPFQADQRHLWPRRPVIRSCVGSRTILREQTRGTDAGMPRWRRGISDHLSRAEHSGSPDLR